ncbi:double-strand-break repair protein rad21 homolog, putative [Leishmania donovani]|uniref:Double-strand-break repair protein rad21 homolog, putative n=1 Tax=Leishmania donovani TaxID=5661 RepID=E9B8J9_LEIDO|nr:double-strand-break repair protein rad21 homolog, putative [Leishmania donovani]AYU76015.1 double-strand-break repair protein rad21-like, putative [Leishmania donovani]CBZ31572.1 double-strand-break repair protein rad21 homolog, putative [Leishmania donovani]
MFFSTYVLTKKGPLAKVWLAAHWDKRLTRHEVKVVDLSQTILHIVRPVVPIALRTSGELLVGVVRIYALKVKHLLKEATEATLFLRVTTLATKGSKAGVAGQHRTTSIDGVVVPVKGSDVEAVTFDWNADVAAKHGAVADAAEALGEGRFNAIADLLGNSHRIEVSETDKEDALLASAWYTVQPTSQAAGDELHTMQQDYDEIAKMRADLMAFGERASGSASTSKSKSSLSSMEKGRGSVAVDVDGMAFPAVGDELDIGVPLPDELPPGFPALDGQVPAGMIPTDPFLLPDMMNMNDEAAAAAQRSRPGRKMRPVNVCDLDSTTLSREAFEKCIADRSDILNSEPRRGPYDAQEEADRYTVTGSANAANAVATNPAMDAAPLSGVLNPALRLAYATALRQSAEEAVAMAAQAFRESMARRSEVPAGVGGALEADDAQVAAADLDGSSTLLPEEEVAQQRRKRGRDDSYGVDDSTMAAGVSASAQQTLERIRMELSLRAARDRKKPRTQSVASLVGASCALREVCRGLRRRDAARTFVDVLALASKQYVSAQQAPGSDEVQVTLNESALRLLAAA